MGWTCAVVGGSSYTGSERVYRLDHPGESKNYTVTLDSPCGELDLFSLYWSDDTCPSAAIGFQDCDGDIASGGGSLDIWNSSPRSYLIYGDGPTGDKVNFGLSVTCN